ncbi:uncharacterized protein L199_001011 [Kwoniella botswanensis]|uniref:uncharacterized protein n=1 Tax=Kwoniella botswanensis TaxID=1268659 RepID=UPI00315D88CA
MTSKQDNTLQAAAEDTISPASAASDAQSTEATRKDTRTLDDYLKIQQRDMTAPNRARSTWNQMTYSAPGQGTDTDTGEANRSSLNRCAHCSGSTASGGWSCIKHVGCACHGAALIIGACGIFVQNS